ncbi:MAG: acetolactate decarboxylase [Draconibacterium sp.]|nr:acetolactate decarboxylase [Draconibacterium sp.]
MRYCILFALVPLILFSCNSSKQNNQQIAKKTSDKIYQYSLFTALANSVYDGELTVAEVKEKGDLGIGTYNAMDGEMIVVDGNVYQLFADGSVLQPDDEVLVPFTVVTFFDEDKNFGIDVAENYADLQSKLRNKLQLNNLGVAFRITGDFEYIKCGGANKQPRPFTKTLSEALEDRPIYEKENISGTMVGFWYPQYVGKVNVVGFHLHFLSEEKDLGGHVMELKVSNLKVSVDICDGFEIELPVNEDFTTTNFDLSQEYNNKKKD